jgi:hypothetical protein
MSRSRYALLTIICSLLLPTTAWAEEVVRSIKWQELAAAKKLTSGTVVQSSDGADGPSLRVVHKGTTPTAFPLLTIEQPGISTMRYALKGRVRYEGVATGSYLEMWNHLPEGAFFTRTMDLSGPMGRLEGTSGWRDFILPFNRTGGSPPQKLVFNLVMAGPGKVEIGPVTLVQFSADENLAGAPGAWWSDRRSALLGSIAGSALGILGAAIGWLGSTGRARAFVLGTLKAFAWLGSATLVLGVGAIAAGQPYVVYYPLILLGTIGASLGFALPRSLSRRYEELELRRMQALDA